MACAASSLAPLSSLASSEMNIPPMEEEVREREERDVPRKFVPPRSEECILRFLWETDEKELSLMEHSLNSHFSITHWSREE